MTVRHTSGVGVVLVWRHISLLFADIPEVKVYMDNILLATGGTDKDMTDDDLIAHACLVVKMIDRMTEYNLWVRPEKCFFIASAHLVT